MSIGNVSQSKSEWENLHPSHAAHAASASEIVLEIHRKPLKVKRGKITDIAKGLSEIAFSMGETNDPDSFSKELEEDILEALKLVQKRQKKQKRG